ncbi:MAG TPA: TetR family transcriptional regulator [Catenuloplanes sp.]|jgi:AcrR family transcriptional regulator
MTPSGSPPKGPGLRERRKAETRRSIQEHALRLFLANGYDATTVEEIATAAGVSHMTFFRHFDSKPAVVESDDYDPMLAEMIGSRPDHEDPLTAIRRAVVTALRAMPAAERQTVLVRTRLIMNVPALRARQEENQRTTRDLFGTAIAARADRPDSPFAIRVLAAVAVAVLTTTLYEWAGEDGRADLADLVDAAFAALPGSR